MVSGPMTFAGRSVLPALRTSLSSRPILSSGPSLSLRQPSFRPNPTLSAGPAPPSHARAYHARVIDHVRFLLFLLTVLAYSASFVYYT